MEIHYIYIRVNMYIVPQKFISKIMTYNINQKVYEKLEHQINGIFVLLRY